MSLRRHAAHMRVPSLCARAHAPTAPPHTRHPHTSERAPGPHESSSSPRALYEVSISIYYLCPPPSSPPRAGCWTAGGGCGWPSSLPRCAPCFTLSVARAAYRAPSRPFSLLLPFPFCPSLTCSPARTAHLQLHSALRASAGASPVSRLQASLSHTHSAHAHTSQSRTISSKSPQSPPPLILIPLGQSNHMSHVYAGWPVDQWWMVDWWTCGAGGYRRDAFYGALSMSYAL